MLAICRFANRNNSVLRVRRLDPDAKRDYAEYFGDKDVLMPPALARPAGELMTEYSLIPPTTLHGSEIFGGYYSRYDIPHLLVLWAVKSDAAIAAMTLQRSRLQGPFLRGDQERYRVVVPHLMRALQIRRAVLQSRVRAEKYRRVLDQVGSTSKRCDLIAGTGDLCSRLHRHCNGIA